MSVIVDAVRQPQGALIRHTGDLIALAPSTIWLRHGRHGGRGYHNTNACLEEDPGEQHLSSMSQPIKQPQLVREQYHTERQLQITSSPP
jgi:hypothetical protein